MDTGQWLLVGYVVWYSIIIVWGVTNRWPLKGYVDPMLFWLFFLPLAMLFLYIIWAVVSLIWALAPGLVAFLIGAVLLTWWAKT